MPVCVSMGGLRVLPSTRTLSQQGHEREQDPHDSPPHCGQAQHHLQLFFLRLHPIPPHISQVCWGQRFPPAQRCPWLSLRGAAGGRALCVVPQQDV